MSLPKDLPRFDRPPVVEVALSVQFESLSKLHAAAMGLFWGKFRDRFPNVEQHPPVQHQVERKGARRQLESKLEFVFKAGAEPTPRLWMVNDASSELLQLQSDRFVRNWRRYHDQTLPYPHYAEHIRPSFKRDFGVFEEFVQTQSLGSLTVDQCEVTYINHITPAGVWKTHGDLHRVFRGWSSKYYEGLPADGVNIKAYHEIQDESGEFAGHLYLQIDSAFTAPKSSEEQATPVFVMQLVARGRPLGKGTKGAFRFLDLGRSTIVNAFANMTTERMHVAWGRTK